MTALIGRPTSCPAAKGKHPAFPAGGNGGQLSLVIGQPEDELDNRFLFDTVLSVLKKLCGRRKVIVATHNANVVVNGDADMVIRLDATARREWVAGVGAIKEPVIRDAIVRTVDGEEDAFHLRRRKYGF